MISFEAATDGIPLRYQRQLSNSRAENRAASTRKMHYDEALPNCGELAMIPVIAQGCQRHREGERRNFFA
jgi:hypothetical protein